MNDTDRIRRRSTMHAALLPLCRRGNPFARLALDHFSHARALADVVIAGTTRAEVYACVRLARRYGALPEGCYFDGYVFEDFADHDGLAADALPALREHAWAFRDTLVALSVETANETAA